MATINFLYRSTKETGNLTLRLLFSINGKGLSIYGNTKISISKVNWDLINKSKSKRKDISIINLKTEIESKTTELQNHILGAFEKANPSDVNKEWLINQIDLYYNPPIEDDETKDIPKDLINYIDYYLEYRKHELKETSVKKINVIKHKLERLQKERKRVILIKDINEKFKKEFESYLMKNNYSQNTLQREFVFIKSFCKHAQILGLEVNNQLDSLSFKREKIDKIYLSFDDLQKIENIDLDLLTDSLQNVRDWLIISCYTGQRISDFMRFKKEMISLIDGHETIHFKQKKTQKEMSVPLHKKVLEILKKRNGNFPYPISDQKYNDYIKDVCKIANIDEVVKGKLLKEIKNDDGEYRKVEDYYPKWQLVSSHIGRRSFATNFYGNIPTTYLIYITGHSTEREFLNYIGKSNTDLMKGVINYFK